VATPKVLTAVMAVDTTVQTPTLVAQAKTDVVAVGTQVVLPGAATANAVA
jgi:hypothetical protein